VIKRREEERMTGSDQEERRGEDEME